MQQVLHDDAVRLAFSGGPRRPADQPVDRILLLDIVDRQLVTGPVEVLPRSVASGGVKKARAGRNAVGEDTGHEEPARPEGVGGKHEPVLLLR